MRFLSCMQSCHRAEFSKTLAMVLFGAAIMTAETTAESSLLLPRVLLPHNWQAILMHHIAQRFHFLQ